jgi:hypothetical protein
MPFEITDRHHATVHPLATQIHLLRDPRFGIAKLASRQTPAKEIEMGHQVNGYGTNTTGSGGCAQRCKAKGPGAGRA